MTTKIPTEICSTKSSDMSQKPFASVGSQIAYMIQREAFDELDGPIHRLATIDAPAIYSPPVEAEQLPNPQRVLKAALQALA